jgi:protein involved in polysaccharide export with SLBB domain
MQQSARSAGRCGTIGVPLRSLVVVFVLLGLPLGALCQPTGSVTNPAPGAAVRRAQITPTPTLTGPVPYSPALSRRATIIRPGDILDVQIAGEPELSGQFPVTANGTVKLAGFIGVLRAAGVDTARFAELIAQSSRKYLVEPTVSVTVVGRPAAWVNILGEVPRQGAFDIDQAPTLLTLLALAGGVAPTGDASLITIVRGGREQRVLPEGAAAGPDVIPPDEVLQEGDTVVVPKRAVRFVMVTGAVQRAGYFPVEQAGSAVRALILAGGASVGAELSRSYVLRGADRIDVNLASLMAGAPGGTGDVPLEDKDVLVVPLVSAGGVPGAPEVVVLAGGLGRTGAMPLSQGATAARAVMVAGGVTPEAKPESSYIIRAGGRVDVDIRAIISGSAPDVALQANDILVVPILPRDLAFVIGAVMRPGPQLMLAATTVVRAVTMAGGTTPTADLKAAYILRQDQRRAVDLEAALGNRGPDPALEPNDVLVVPEAGRLPVFVVGAVNRPGALDATAANTVAKALSLSGGTQAQADAKHAFILRGGTRLEIDVDAIMTGGPDIALQPNDMLTVPVLTAAGQIAQSVLVFGAVARPSAVPLSSANTARRAVLMAGGLLPTADVANAQLMRRDTLARIDLQGVLDGRVEDFAVDGGDVIMIPQKAPDVVYLTGAVSRAGQQLLGWCNTLARGLAAAGPVPQGDLTKTYILRGSERVEVNAERVLTGADADVPLVANDVVVVPVQTPTQEAASQASRSVAVMGAVVRPGLLTPEQGGTVARAMAWVGGTAAQADLEHAYLLRGNQTQNLNLSKLGAATADAPDSMELRAGDVIVVPALTPELAAAQQLARNVMVVGAVARPGIVDATQAASAWKAVILCGGPTEGADLVGAYIMRAGERTPVDLQAISSVQAQDPSVRAGDVVVVPSVTQEVVFVAGAVQKPGPLPCSQARTATVALSMAGGPTETALLGEAYVLRKGVRNAVALQAAPTGPSGEAAPDLALAPNDLLFIPARYAETVYVAGAVQRPGALPLHQASTASAALTLAGGATTGAETKDAYVLRNGIRLAANLQGSGADLALVKDDVLIIPLVSPEPVYVVGNVKAPGPQPFAQARTAGKALVMAGGAIDDLADLKNAYVLRQSQRLPVDLDAVVNQGNADADVVLQANDAVIIPKLDDQYQVVGEVLRPGPQNLKAGKTVLAALALAGGPSPLADLSACTILRGGQSVPVDLEALLENNDYADNIDLQSGDTLIVARRMERVFVFGQVPRPGAYPYSNRETLMDVIAKAGGIVPPARVDRIWLVRATQAEHETPTTAATAPAQPRPRRKVTSTPWLEERHWGYEVQQPFQRAQTAGAKPAAAAPAAPRPRERYTMVELAKLPPGSPEAKPRDGDLIYVPAPGQRSNTVMDWIMNLLPGWLLYRN